MVSGGDRDEGKGAQNVFLSVKQGTPCKGVWCAQGKAVLVLQPMDNQGRNGAWHHHKGNPHVNVKFLTYPSSTQPWPGPGQPQYR